MLHRHQTAKSEVQETEFEDLSLEGAYTREPLGSGLAYYPLFLPKQLQSCHCSERIKSPGQW